MNIIFIGCGGVGGAILELFLLSNIGKNRIQKFQKIIIIDPIEKHFDLTDNINKKYNIEVKRIFVELTENNYLNYLNKYTKTGDLIIDVSYNVYFKPLIEFCLQEGIHYVNTSMERWKVEDEDKLDNVCHRSLFTAHNMALELHDKYKKMNKLRSTLLVLHGMNPGLISHFTFKGIMNIAKDYLSNKEIKKAYDNNDYAKLAYLLKIRTIHCSERDTQILNTNMNTNTNTNKSVFYNTWSPYAFYAEGVDPVQLGHRQDDKILEDKIYGCSNTNQKILNIRGIDLLMYSFVPIIKHEYATGVNLVDSKSLCNNRHLYDKGYLDNFNDRNGHIVGMAVSHSENDTINRALTLYDDKGNIVYCPSNYYVYSPCEKAWQSINNVRLSDYKMLKNQMVMTGDNIMTGDDAVGSLIIFEENNVFKSYWIGTILHVNEIRRKGIKYSNTTTIQVGISILSALDWL